MPHPHPQPTTTTLRPPPPDSLTANLEARGYTHRPQPGSYRHDVLDGAGLVVATGSAFEVWCWLATATDYVSPVALSSDWRAPVRSGLGGRGR